MKPFPFKSLVTFLAVACCFEATAAASDSATDRLASPDGRIEVTFLVNATGAPRYAIQRDGRPVLRESRLGLVRDDADFSQGLRLTGASPKEPVLDRYEILTAKRA